MGFHVREVWKHNLTEEISAMEEALSDYPIVSVDSEFPGFLRSTPRHAAEDVRFSDMKYNVDNTDLIQLGVALSNDKGTVAAIWQFNLEFDLDRDLHAKESIHFLQTHGIDFGKLKSDGIQRLQFSVMLGGLISRRKRPLTWVTFHGLYDLAHIVRAVTRRPIPDSAAEFGKLLGKGFDAVVDMKHVSKYYEATGSEVGLQRLADELGVKRRGEAHTAGSDSLLTALVYSKLKKKVKHVVHQDVYVDFLYGISARIQRRSSSSTPALPRPPSMVVPLNHHVYHVAVPAAGPVPVPVVYGIRSCGPQYPSHHQSRRKLPPRLISTPYLSYLAAV